MITTMSYRLEVRYKGCEWREFGKSYSNLQELQDEFKRLTENNLLVGDRARMVVTYRRGDK